MRAWIAVCLVGCSYNPSGSSPDQPIDGPGNAVQDVSMALEAAPVCVGGSFLTVCVDAPGLPRLVNTAIDTGGSVCMPYTSTPPLDICVLSGTSIEVAGTVRATGPRPLVLVSTGTIVVSGTLDLSSHRSDNRGAGSEPTTCVPPQNASTAISTTSGGAAGGSFGGAGGNGGTGGNGGNGGIAAAASIVSTLRGGCAGGDGRSFIGGAEGERGRGGGAVALLAESSITIGDSAMINVSGSGGGRGRDFIVAGNAGAGSGGGGGSGGMILLDGTSIAVTGNGRMMANGGGGGEGASNDDDGNSGGDPIAPNSRPSGGNGGASTGGDGGGGTGATNPNGENAQSGTDTASSGGGGGGGGGGAGAIKIFGTATNVLQANVAPVPTS